MTPSCRLLRLLSLGIAMALAVSAAGCAAGSSGTAIGGGSSDSTAVPPERRAPGSNQAAGDAENVSPLPIERRSELASGFPLEVPVADGSITGSEAQGNAAWTYEMTIAATPFDVAAWYRDSYAAANWGVVRDQVGANGGAIIFAKGAGAQSKIRLAAVAGGTTVLASVGVGEAVGETY